MTRRPSYWIREKLRIVVFAVLGVAPAAAGCAGRAVIPLDLRGGFLVAQGVFVHGHGPMDFLVDTGAQSSSIDTGVGERAGLEPRYRVEVLTPAGLSLAPAVGDAEVRVKHEGGSAELGAGAAVEFLLQPLAAIRAAVPGVDGVLGANALFSQPLLIDLDRLEMVLCPEAHEIAPATARGGFQDGRLWVEAVVPEAGPGPVRLTVDSGADTLLLFHPPGAPPAGVRPGAAARLATATGEAGGLRAELRRVQVGGVALPPLPAVFVATPRAKERGEAGLLPVRYLRLVAVNPAEGSGRVQVRQPALSRASKRAAARTGSRP